MLLSACGTSERVVTQIETVRVTVPDSLLTCPDAPVPPVGDAVMQSHIADWAVAMYEAHAVCRAQLDAIRGLMHD